jgi:hypothetical protein
MKQANCLINGVLTKALMIRDGDGRVSATLEYVPSENDQPFNEATLCIRCVQVVVAWLWTLLSGMPFTNCACAHASISSQQLHYGRHHVSCLV